MILLILSFLFAALLCNFLAGRFCAMQDALKHYPRSSVFAKTSKLYDFRFGIRSEFWYNQNYKDWLGKFEGYDQTRPKRKFKILLWKIHIVQFCDGWHWFKMWNVVFEKLDSVFYSISAILFFSFTGSAALTLLYLFSYFWLAGITWMISFNKHYDKWLRV